MGRDELLAEIGTRLADPERGGVVVLHGQPGVGKSETAREFGRRNLERYPGGAFVVDAAPEAITPRLARIGRNHLGLDLPSDLSLEDQAIRVLAHLASETTLVVFDNASSPDSLEVWLPPSGGNCQVLITSVVDRWDNSWSPLAVPPLSDDAGHELMSRLAGQDLANRYGSALIGTAAGLPIQLVPAALALEKAEARGRADAVVKVIAAEAEGCFEAVYAQLEPPARLLLQAAARLNAQRIVRRELALHLSEGAGWSDTDFDHWLADCLDLHLLRGSQELDMHQLFAAFLLRGPADEKALAAVRQAQARRFGDLATELADAPASADLVAAMLSYPVNPDAWSDANEALGDSAHAIPRALYETGRFAAARLWFERAVAEKERGDAQGRVDHANLGVSLHEVGDCLSSQGDFTAAQLWFERAVAEKEQGDTHGRVDHANLGVSLHQVGYCLSRHGDFATAQLWFERAVAEKEQGDVHGRISHASLGSSLHQVGYCLSSQGDFAAAQLWFKRAVAEKEQGDVHGRIDHAGLGVSLHQVGYCLSSQGDFDAAQLWFERAVAEKERGDVHGRINHESLGVSLHEVGDCLSSREDFAAAQLWFKRAAAEAEQGDVHGRIDHASLGVSLHQVGYCLSSQADFITAQLWFERAVTEKQQGDVHGRISHASLGSSLHQVGDCLSKQGDLAAALPWFEQAVAEAEQGDLFGRPATALHRKILEAGIKTYRRLGRPQDTDVWAKRLKNLGE